MSIFVNLLMRRGRYLLFSVSFLFTAAMPGLDPGLRIITDRSLLVPGVGAGGMVIGEGKKEVRSRMGAPRKNASFREQRKLFKDIFGVHTESEILFNEFFHYPIEGTTVFFFEGKVVAISSITIKMVTDDAVSLERGISYFFFYYGNRGCETIESVKNKFYIFHSLGIALADDDNNDTIDVIIVFRKRMK